MQREFDESVPECVKTCPAAKFKLTQSIADDHWYKAICNIEIKDPEGNIVDRCDQLLRIEYQKLAGIFIRKAIISAPETDNIGVCNTYGPETIVDNMRSTDNPEFYSYNHIT